jgi:predicted RecA/RadA family phage recombinase
MRNYQQEGETVTLTAPSGGVVSGVGYVIGSMFVVATSTVAETLPFEGQTDGIFVMPKAASGSGKAFTEGEAVFWNNTLKQWDKTGSGFFQVGVVVAAALTTATTCVVAINRRVLTAV